MCTKESSNKEKVTINAMLVTW